MRAHPRCSSARATQLAERLLKLFVIHTHTFFDSHNYVKFTPRSIQTKLPRECTDLSQRRLMQHFKQALFCDFSLILF